MYLKDVWAQRSSPCRAPCSHATGSLTGALAGHDSWASGHRCLVIIPLSDNYHNSSQASLNCPKAHRGCLTSFMRPFFLSPPLLAALRLLLLLAPCCPSLIGEPDCVAPTTCKFSTRVTRHRTMAMLKRQPHRLGDRNSDHGLRSWSQIMVWASFNKVFPLKGQKLD